MQDWSLGWSLLATFLFVIAFRGGIDVLAHKLIPRASLYGAGRELLDEDVVARRRVWYWRHKYRVAFVLALLVDLRAHGDGRSPASPPRRSATGPSARCR